MGLAPDCFDGSAWVSLVTFQMRSLRITHVPTIPTTHNFAEVNVRTYVNGPDGPGVWFCSLDAPSVLPPKKSVTARDLGPGPRYPR